MEQKIYVTVSHLDDFEGSCFLRTGETLRLVKDKDNPYDDEAIVARSENGCRCGYVANSVTTVARGTYSAGRVYDLFEGETECLVRFIFTEEGCLIAELGH